MITDLAAFVQQISNFSSWNHAERIRFFAWFVHAHRGREQFMPAEIGRCYDELHLAQPASIGNFVTKMVERKEALRAANGYRLERRAREPFDQKYGQRPSAAHVDRLLVELPAKVPSIAERKFLDETIRCFRAGAYRATVGMAWNMAYSHLCDYVLDQHLTTFNAQLGRAFPRQSSVSKFEDFLEMKESQMLEVCRGASIITGNVDKILREKLQRRNIAAHPSEVDILAPTAEEVIRDLVENVVLRLV